MKQTLEYMGRYRRHWRDKPESYWLARLQEEVAELTLTLDGQHEGPVAHELRQIISMCLNWLDKRGEYTDDE